MLNVLTFGILGVFFVNPYYMLTVAGAYEWLRTEAIRDGLLPPDPEEAPAPETASASPQEMPTTCFCTHCGAVADRSDRCCMHCGNLLL